VTRDIAIVSFAQAPLDQPPGMSETTMLLPTITDALERVGMTRRDVGFTCSGSADYLTGGTFTFVQMLEAAGAWPPISESHVEMDGAWALYEAYVRLLHGDVDVALVYASGRAGLSVSLRETLVLQNDPYYLVPLGADYVSLSALQAQAVLTATGRTERDLAEIVIRARRDAKGSANAAVSGDFTIDDLLAKDQVVAPLREHDIGPPVDGAAAVVLVAGERARDLVERPAWIAGIDHRADPHYPGMRDLARSPSTARAGEHAGVSRGGVQVAELTTVCSADELVLRAALGLGDEVAITPSGGSLVGNATMVDGLARIGAAFRAVSEGGRQRALGHASSGPCLQQNLVCVLETREQ
jgi:acetyl-CoA acetyltransferase